MATEKKTLSWEICLENTRLLVKGVERLRLGYERAQSKRDRDSWQLGELQRFVMEEYHNSIQGEEYLAQNPYAELFQFRFQVPDTAQMEGDSFRLSGMILLCHQLRVLEDLPLDQLAEAYETLCNSIRNILEADMCYLVSRNLTDTRMLCASSIMENDLDTQLGGREAGDLLNQLEEGEKFIRPIEGIFLKKEEGANPANPGDAKKNPDTLVLPIMLYDKKGKLREEQAYLICQRRGKPCWSHDIYQTILRVRDTLFLRGKLAQALVRDLAGLLTVAREFRSIPRRSSEPGPLKILHVSDLHVEASNFEQLKKDIKELKLEDTPFDFLVITGDVVRGRYAAGDLEQNYDRAAEVIRALAMRIWGEDQDGKKILSQDWKRRTIVIPGNHDYASMNELETQHGENHRASESGKPATREGSAMAKFTYYINFVRKLLDIEIGELIDNSLNELRCYDKMNVAFMCFNTSVMANPSRNNKVHLDQDFVHHAIRQLSAEKGKQVVIFLGHHGPDYTIDYVSDEYLEPFICQRITQGFADALQETSSEEQKGRLKELRDSMDRLEPSDSGDIVDNDFVQAWLQRNEPKVLPPDVEKKVIKRRKKTRLYNQLIFLIEQLEKDESERSINERYQKIVAEVRRARLLSTEDKKFYDGVFQKLQESLDPAVCLSGHTHIWGKDEEYEENHCVAKRFSWVATARERPGSEELKQIHFLNYGVCEIPTSRPCPKDEIRYHKREEEIGS